ncbi:MULTISPECIES: hypothetical protein [Okeania]|uniref:hypothetical protein n=1 Tax=Okeania TaxID=1458928 RepID=UPI000F5338C4|nr:MULTISPECIES: hypothetical protein [Okeania]
MIEAKSKTIPILPNYRIIRVCVWKVLWVRGGDRRQETGEMGNLEELVEYFIPQFFCNYSPFNPNFLLAQAEKARPTGAKKSLKPLSVD